MKEPVLDLLGVSLVVGRVVVVFLALLVGVMLVVWAERKIIADMQSRIGPNRAGPFGLLQTIADGVKLFMKEDIIPAQAERFLFCAAPILTMVPAFLAFSVVPFGEPITIAGRVVPLQLADLNIGLLFFLAAGSMSVYGIALAGWSSGSKYPLFGAVRSTAQMISYEISMGLSVIPVVLYTGSVSPSRIVEAQSDGWFIIVLAPAFILFLLSGIAETNRAPFDLPEAEGELVAGFHTEYSGVKFAMFFLAEYIHVITISAMATTLFLGGPNGPHLGGPEWVWPIAWFFLKVFAFIFLFFWLRASFPRLRYDQLMDVGWKWLIPAGVIWIPLSAAALAFPSQRLLFYIAGIGGALVLLGAFVAPSVEAQKTEAALEEEVVR